MFHTMRNKLYTWSVIDKVLDHLVIVLLVFVLLGVPHLIEGVL